MSLFLLYLEWQGQVSKLVKLVKNFLSGLAVKALRIALTLLRLLPESDEKLFSS